MNAKFSATPRSGEDLFEQYVYIGLDNIIAARRFLESANKTFQTLADMPAMGVKRSYKRLKNVRMFPVSDFKNHLIYYQPTPNGVKILRVFYASRDIRKILS